MKDKSSIWFYKSEGVGTMKIVVIDSGMELVDEFVILEDLQEDIIIVIDLIEKFDLTIDVVKKRIHCPSGKVFEFRKISKHIFVQVNSSNQKIVLVM